MDAAIKRETEQGSNIEVKNAVNRQQIICLMQGIY